MGCDIHLMVERRDAEGEWSIVHLPSDGAGNGLDASVFWVDHVDHVHPAAGEGRLGPAVYVTPRAEMSWYSARSYALFAMLADVRNYQGIRPISQPRGVPADASDRWRSEVEWNGSDYHSHSWLTVAELRDYADRHLTHEQRAWTFWDEVLPQLEALGDPDHVRIVFAFDN